MLKQQLKRAARLPLAFVKRPHQTWRYLAEISLDRLSFPLYRRRNPAVAALIDEVLAQNLTFLHRRNLADLADVVREADRQELPGVLVEAGAALGGSAIVMAKTKSAVRELLVYDAFGMIPPPSERDGRDVHARYDKIVAGKAAGIGGEVYYGYRSDLLDEVRDSFRQFGVYSCRDRVQLVPGFFEETLFPSTSVAVAHVDADWHDSVKICLERLGPLVVVGGRLIVDDYYGYSGCRRAVDEFLALPENVNRYVLEKRSRLHLIKTS